MTRRREIENHRHSLDEIRNIMNSMKNLSYMETRKLSKFLAAQHAVVSNIETVAEDFLGFYSDVIGTPENTLVEVYVVVGSERGFCGDFNHSLLRHFDKLTQNHVVEHRHVIFVGHKLHMLVPDSKYDRQLVEGASVVEEVTTVLNQLVQQLAAMHDLHESLNLYVMYINEEQVPVSRQLLPPFQHCLGNGPQHVDAPLLQLDPRQFFLDLGYHYLYAVLHEILYTSLMTENRRRVMHLEAAVRHMEEQSEQLRHQSNVLRQEEIIEEIEVILLSTVSLDDY